MPAPRICCQRRSLQAKCVDAIRSGATSSGPTPNLQRLLRPVFRFRWAFLGLPFSRASVMMSRSASQTEVGLYKLQNAIDLPRVVRSESSSGRAATDGSEAPGAPLARPSAQLGHQFAFANTIDCRHACEGFLTYTTATNLWLLPYANLFYQY